MFNISAGLLIEEIAFVDFEGSWQKQESNHLIGTILVLVAVELLIEWGVFDCLCYNIL